MLISANEILNSAKKGGYAFPHFNYWDELSIRAELAAAENKNCQLFWLGQKSMNHA